MMSQESAIKFLQLNGVDVTHMNYNLISDLIAIADKVAEVEFKRTLLRLCKPNEATEKGGVE